MLVLLWLIIISPSMVRGCDEISELKIDYLENLINDLFNQSKNYKVPTDNSNYFQNENLMNSSIEYGTFDFIVIGGGSSGSIVSSRLSEVVNWTVLLLEAGDFDDDITNMPYIYNLLQYTNRNWGYFSTPQKNAYYGRKNRQLPYPRGRVLGGTGSINGLAFTRGNKGDYDEWATLGNPGWSYDDLLPYFKKMENFESKNIDIHYRGFAGPLNVAYKKPEQELSELLSYASDLGMRYIADYNAKNQIGVSKHQRNIRCGKRESGATAYVRPAMNRINFNLTLRAFATKIIIDRNCKVAKGVEFVRDGKRYRALAKKEVIISAGAVNSPQILMLSGVGPEDELRKHNIPIIQSLPVGQHMKDHPALRIIYRSNHTIPKKSFRNLLKEYVQGEGMLTNMENILSYVYINTDNQTSTVPNLEFALIANTPVPESTREITNYIPKVEKYFQTVNEQTDYSVIVYVLHPKSSGTIKLKSNDPRDFPLIDLALFSDLDDLELIYRSLKVFELIEQTSYAKKRNLKKLDFTFCDEYDRNSKPYWYCVIQNLGYSAYHISSTVKMGPRQDPLAVVDNKLRVYGIGNLRVADCSIMPTTNSGHTNSACFVIGERAAGWIKADYGVPITQ